MDKPTLDSIDGLMLIQPNNVTFGRYNFSAIQENILTLAIEALQKHKTKEAVIQTDLWGQPKITVICEDAVGKTNKYAVKEALRDMVKKPFEFKWVHPNMGKSVETGGVIFTTWHDIKETNRIELTLNVWAIPFLVYYGVGVGGTKFNKAIALNLNGEYPKRIYKMICRWQDTPSFNYSIDQFRKDLELPSSYNNTRMEERVLRPAVEKIKESGSDVWFEYELLCLKPVKGRKPKADTIQFNVKTRHPKEVGGEQFEVYQYVYRWLCTIWDNMQSNKAMEVADKLTEMGVLNNVNARIGFYDDQLAKGEKTKEHVKNSIKKMLREEYRLS